MSEKETKDYIDFKVTQYSLPKICEVLYANGVTDGTITVEDGELHIRWKQDSDKTSKKQKSVKNVDNKKIDVNSITEF